VYLTAAVATALATAIPLAMTPASGLAARPAATELTRPYLVTARGRAAARDLVGEVRWRVRRYYTAVLPGFATWLSARELEELRADPRVRSIEPDRPIHPLPFSGSPSGFPEAGDAPGAGVTVYVVDSGLDPARAEFGDRAWRAFDATGGVGDDCSGHGTRVARAATGRASGVAPEARTASVRVLGCDGTGSLSDVIAGIDWVRRHARGPSVVNVSFDGADSPALDTALGRLVRAGKFVTGATGSGGCRIAPNGVAYSAGAPHLSGSAARYLGIHPGAAPAAVASWLKCTAAHDTIHQNPSRVPRVGRF
jgi:hypothetical protein